MSDTLQYGRNMDAAWHPDADQLSAFAEQALPAHEREQTLQHLAECAHCREIVALSLPHEDELPVIVAGAVPAEAPVLGPILVPGRKKNPWFSGWNIAWPVGMAAAAAALALAFVFQSQNDRVARRVATEAQIAKTVEPPLPAPGAPIPERPQRAAAPLPKAGFAPTRPNESAAEAAKGELEARPAPQMGLRSTPAAGGTRSAAMQAPLVAPVSADSLAKPSAATASPAAPQLQAAMKPQSDLAPPAGSLQSAQVSVAAAADIPPAQQEAVSPTLVVNRQQIAELPLTPVNLPDGKVAISVASQGLRRVAIDAEHRAFFSLDGGQHWQPIAAPWAGHAVRVDAAVVRPAANGFRMGLMGHSAASARGNSAQGNPPAAVAAAAQANPVQSVAGALVAPGFGITGTVTDTSGAAIPGATVIATDSVTGAALTAKTDATGHYRFDGLAQGVYKIGAQATGFDRQEFSGIAVGTREAAVRNFTLNVGAATQTVTVTADALALEAPEPKKKARLAPLFTMTTDTGERWVSADGQTWARD